MGTMTNFWSTEIIIRIVVSILTKSKPDPKTLLIRVQIKVTDRISSDAFRILCLRAARTKQVSQGILWTKIPSKRRTFSYLLTNCTCNGSVFSTQYACAGSSNTPQPQIQRYMIECLRSPFTALRGLECPPHSISPHRIHVRHRYQSAFWNVFERTTFRIQCRSSTRIHCLVFS